MRGNAPIVSPLASLLLAVASLMAVTLGANGIVWSAQRFGPLLHDRSTRSLILFCGAMFGSSLAGIISSFIFLLICKYAPFERVSVAGHEAINYTIKTPLAPMRRSKKAP